MEPNHHADLPGFSGIFGLLAGVGMTLFGGKLWRIAASVGGVGSGTRVLDVGCGPGSACRHAAGLGATVVGIDPADVMLGLARRLTREGDISYETGVAEDVPADDDSFDVAWSIRTVHHWPDLEGGITEADRVLRPGGRFVAVERGTTEGATGLASHGWTRQQADAFAERCLEGGFASVDVAEHPTGRRSRALVVVATAG